MINDVWDGRHRLASSSDEEDVNSRRLRVPISKSSGKHPPYFLFLNAEGRATFRRHHGYEFCHRSTKDQEKMTVIYKALTPERLQHYKDLAASEYNSAENRRKRRHAAEKRRREEAHRDPVRYSQVQTEHRQVVERNQERDRVRLGPVIVPKPDSIWEANTMRPTDFLLKQEVDRKELGDKFQFTENSMRNGLCSGMLDRKFQFVGVLYFCTVLEGKKLFVYPAELAIVSFTLRLGVTSWESCNLSFTPDVFYNPDVEAPREAIIESAQANGRQFGIPLDSESSYTAPQAWTWIRHRIDTTALLCCDEMHYNYVYPALKTLALSTTELADDAYLQKYVKMYTLQSILGALCSLTSAGSSVSSNELASFLSKPREAVEHYCDTHSRMRLDNLCRKSCQLAFAARKLELVFEFCRNRNIVGMREVFRENRHKYCVEVVGRHAELPSHPQLAEDAGPPAESDIFAVLVTSSDEDELPDLDPQALDERINNMRGNRASVQNTGRPAEERAPRVASLSPSLAAGTMPGPSYNAPHSRPSSAGTPASVPFTSLPQPPPPRLGRGRITTTVDNDSDSCNSTASTIPLRRDGPPPPRLGAGGRGSHNGARTEPHPAYPSTSTARSFSREPASRPSTNGNGAIAQPKFQFNWVEMSGEEFQKLEDVVDSKKGRPARGLCRPFNKMLI